LLHPGFLKWPEAAQGSRVWAHGARTLAFPIVGWRSADHYTQRNDGPRGRDSKLRFAKARRQRGRGLPAMPVR
jgi:hypothetical protein